MRQRFVVMAVLLGVVVAACGGGTASKGTGGAQVNLSVWAQWTDRDFDSFNQILRDFERKHPRIKVTAVPGESDTPKLVGAIGAGNPPDLVATYTQDQIGKLCSSSAFQDLRPRITKAGITASLFPPVAVDAVTYRGKQCALPYGADTLGLYYNKALLQKAGIDRPPRTISELTEAAKKTTELNPDGSIKVAGFVPLMGFYENYLIRYAPLWGATYFDQSGKASFSRDPRWAELFNWQKSLIDTYGYDKLNRFAASAGDAGSAANGFETGKIAMELDGEWRTQTIAREHPELDYGTTALPVPDNHAELSGASMTAINFVGIPRGAKHPDEAFELARYLATDTPSLVRFMNALHNIPTTKAALASPDLKLGPNFAPFLEAFANPHSSFPPAIEPGPVYEDPMTDFVDRWQAGKVPDLQEGLRKLDQDVDTLVAHG